MGLATPSTTSLLYSKYTREEKEEMAPRVDALVILGDSSQE
jgi:hypothetical protein